ncbi:MAG: sigma-54-dependent Fis family transcriptional regulator [Bryobacteraceae bacterium]|nr:sigma-54-dependent Fis family transcriptional regulator [Bryobacteraceae bacterium]
MVGSPPFDCYDFLGAKVIYASAEMKDILRRVRDVAICDAAVLVTGESGVGKEGVVRAVHYFSRRSSGPWVDINCGAVPEHLFESELFGYEKGAFSGADHAKPGMFDLASKGTLLLDEVGDLDLRLQVKLLRVLDSGEYYRLGGVKKYRADVRVIASTNSDLRALVDAGRFRKDLYYRLAQVQFQIPPLRDRRSDILALLFEFSRMQSIDVEYSEESSELLMNYSWPGNVRELRNFVLGLSGSRPGRLIGPADLPVEIREHKPQGEQFAGSLARLLAATRIGEVEDPDVSTGLLEKTELALIQMVLRQMNGHQEKSAEVLGISSRTLRRKLQALQDRAPGIVMQY